MVAKKQQRTKGQHTVPRCYLERFTRDGRTLFVFDKFDRRTFASGPAKVAKQNLFYDYPPGVVYEGEPTRQVDPQVLEKVLSVLESWFNSLLGGILQHVEVSGMTADQVARMSLYVAIQWMRTRGYREAVREIATKTMQSIADDLVEKNYSGLPKDEYPKVSYKEEMLPFLHNEHFFKEELLFRVAGALGRCFWWVIGLTDENHPLYTSDNPVVRRAHLEDERGLLLGILDPGVEFVYPLTSKHLLLIREWSHFHEMRHYAGKVLTLTPEQVASYNRLQVSKSFRQVYCCDPAFDLAEQVCQELPGICNPNRQRIQLESKWVEPLKSIMTLKALE